MSFIEVKLYKPSRFSLDNTIVRQVLYLKIGRLDICLYWHASKKKMRKLFG